MTNEWDRGDGDGQHRGPEFDRGPVEQHGQQRQPGSGEQYPRADQPPQQDPHVAQSRPQPYPDQHDETAPSGVAAPHQQAWAGQQWAQQQQPMFGPAHGGYGTPPAARSSVLGIVGLIVVLLSTGALAAAAWSFGVGLGDFFLELAETGVPRDQAELMNDPRLIAYAESTGATMGAIALSVLAGVTGWIVSIVATATRRGRVPGIAGIVVGLLSLPVAYGAFTLAMGPAMSQLGG